MTDGLGMGVFAPPVRRGTDNLILGAPHMKPTERPGDHTSA